MRPIHAAKLDKTRPVLVLIRELVRPHLSRVTVAPMTGIVRGLSTEVAGGAGQRGGEGFGGQLRQHRHDSGVGVGAWSRVLFPSQEAALSEAIGAAFDLE